MNSEYPRGSEWRKWDLHVHTPYSVINDYGSDLEKAWQQFVEDLEALPEDFKVLGINDYIFIDGYERLLLEKQNDGRIPNIELILPVVEFRIQKFAGIDFGPVKRINFHVIFSNQVDPKTIQSQFLVALQPAYTVSAGVNKEFWSGVIDRDSIADFGKKLKENVPDKELDNYDSDLIEGFRNLNVDESKIFKLLKESSYFRRKFLTAIGKSEWDQLKWTDASIATKQDIINKVDFVFVAAESPEKYQSARNALRENGVNSLLLDCSDAHNFSTAGVKDRIGNCCTWIKADPTFEGLRQIKYEPMERLRVQFDSPALDYPKPFFSRITACGPAMQDGQPSFSNVDIPLNQNLVTLIGGRGTGKSVLLDSLFLTFDQDEAFEDSRLDRLSPKAFEVEYQKADSERTTYPFGEGWPLDYLHVRQGDIKKIVENPGQLSREIKRLLQIYEEDDPSGFDFELSNLLEKIAKRRAWFSLQDSEGHLINSLEFNEKKVKDNSALIATITTTSNKELIEQYSKNAQSINRINELKKKVVELLSFVKSTKSELSLSVSQVNETAPEDLQLPQPDFDPLEKAASKLSAHIDQSIERWRSQNQQITETFKSQGIDQDVAGLLTKVSQYQKAIDVGNAAIENIEKQKARLTDDIAARCAFSRQIQVELVGRRQKIDEQFASLRQGKDSWTDDQKDLVSSLLQDIGVEGRILFDIESFYQGLAKCLNGQKFRSTHSETQRERIEQKLGVHNFDDYVRLISGEAIISEGDGNLITIDQFSSLSEYFLPNEYDIIEFLYLHQYRSSYLAVNAVIEYKGKPPEKLSVGQRGTFYVSMKLATDPFGSPFVFDQPEDDLDNDFIMGELVPIFRQIKRYRQVIIATHNANLVVNADAEQVIVAFNDEEQLRYESGSLEHTLPDLDAGIRELVCKILEGGRDAFENRERKYGFRVD